MPSPLLALKKKKCQNRPTENCQYRWPTRRKNPYFYLHFENITANKIIGQPNYSGGSGYLNFHWSKLFFFNFLQHQFEFKKKQKKTTNSCCWQANFLSCPKLFFSKITLEEKNCQQEPRGPTLAIAYVEGEWWSCNLGPDLAKEKVNIMMLQRGRGCAEHALLLLTIIDELSKKNKGTVLFTLNIRLWKYFGLNRGCN